MSLHDDNSLEALSEEPTHRNFSHYNLEKYEEKQKEETIYRT